MDETVVNSGQKIRAITTKDRNMDTVQATPRQRVSFNQSSPLTISETGTLLPLGNFSTRDTNTFPTNRYDSTNNKILANPATNYEQGYAIQLDLSLKTNNAGVIVRPFVQFVVPSPSPVKFPLPDSLQRADLGYEISGTGTTALTFNYLVYTSSPIIQYGAQIYVGYTSQRQNANLITGLLTTVYQALTGTQRPQITDATLNMYSI